MKPVINFRVLYGEQIMAIEHERKFLLNPNAGLNAILVNTVSSHFIMQHYVDLDKVDVTLIGPDDEEHPLTVCLDSTPAGDLIQYISITQDEYDQLAVAAGHPHRAVRYRRFDEQFYFTIKIDIGVVGSQIEVEKEISSDTYLLSIPLHSKTIIKRRHIMPLMEGSYSIDVFVKPHGLVLAEIETPEADTVLPHIVELGQEVTGNPQYFNSNL